MATSVADGSPKCFATAVLRAVTGPRPSSARIECHITCSLSPAPPPQSPVSVPSARYLAVRPSGATATQLMPAPQVTATPHGRSASPAASTPARRTANVSLTATADSDQPWRRSAAVSSASSSGRSAPARQAEVCRATAPSPRTPACEATERTRSPRIRMAFSTPCSSWLAPGPRSDASSVPSAATRATSVLLLPPSMASTAASAKPGRPEREGQQRDRRIIRRGLHRRPRHHVVLVGGGGVVKRPVRSVAARAHLRHRGEAGEVARGARPVDGRSQLDPPGAGERPGQVGDLALHAERERRPGAHDERRAPRARPERVVQLPPRERGVAVRSAVLLVERV